MGAKNINRSCSGHVWKNHQQANPRHGELDLQRADAGLLHQCFPGCLLAKRETGTSNKNPKRGTESGDEAESTAEAAREHSRYTSEPCWTAKCPPWYNKNIQGAARDKGQQTPALCADGAAADRALP